MDYLHNNKIDYSDRHRTAIFCTEQDLLEILNKSAWCVNPKLSFDSNAFIESKTKGFFLDA